MIAATLTNQVLHKPVTILLMISFIVFYITSFIKKALPIKFLLHPYGINKKGEYYRLITADLVHHDFMHLALNAYLLFTFGGNLEAYLQLTNRYGSLKYVAIYLFSCLAGTIVTSLLHRKDFGFSSAGASGSLMGCMFSYILLQPRRIALVIPVYGNLCNIYFGLVCIIFLIIYQRKSKNELINHEQHFFGGLGGILMTLVLIPGIIR